MKEFTKAERHKIYKESLKRFDELNSSGLCWVIIRASNIRDIISTMVTDYFPEFALFKPSEGAYTWWDNACNEEFNNQRKLVLMFCIEMTR